MCRYMYLNTYLSIQYIVLCTYLLIIIYIMYVYAVCSYSFVMHCVGAQKEKFIPGTVRYIQVRLSRQNLFLSSRSGTIRHLMLQRNGLCTLIIRTRNLIIRM
uniref:Uncharacterized protein n=1 Tax=Cacopsylla melanoneura TaxID=428564 RepID=A0A8D8XT81_9HEMI